MNDPRTQTCTQPEDTTGVRVISNCSSLEEFITRFRRFCNGMSLFVPTAAPVPLGIRDHFTIALLSGEVVLAGSGEVIESQTADSACGTTRMVGMRIRFDSLTEDSRAVFQWLVAAGALSGATERQQGIDSAIARVRPVTVTQRLVRRWPRAGLVFVAAHTAAAVFGLIVAYQVWGS